ncbi:DNA-binding CsgD family transcriptional regulator [Kineococcus radiotolerans]|uniref:DNA-binding CsgD family transcriptional regulator n=1 Tax=Kineococcus radiotolerans TaxID=131568 RepID=A0A7W4XYX8_KINRA|nr:AAA family ATPase [Kineococcus radiotolerans]MBB2903601.1 DNA-binding CsgD family transcriptional regulator [Kineococcus radiotolerans]
MRVIGRDRELAHFDHLLSTISAEDGHGIAVVIEGEAGIGKSTLMSAVAEAAQTSGFQVLRCQGFESDLAAGFTGLHEMLHPVLDRAETLPARQRSALLTAFGLEDGPPPDRLLISLAVLGLLEEVAMTQPVLVHVEDGQWLDASTAEIVAFLARRLTTAPVLLVATVRQDLTSSTSGTSGTSSTSSAATGVRALTAAAQVVSLNPLSPSDAEQLLDSLGLDLPAPARRRLLHDAGGNPLALREFAAALATGLEVPSEGPLPTTRRLESAFLGELDGLPEASRTVLLLAAADEEVSLPELLAAAGHLGLQPADVDPIERTDLVRVAQQQVRFRHPLLRSTIYGAASSAVRVQAHRALAAVASNPDRAVWHRAAATSGRDEQVAGELEAAATRAAERGAQAVAAAALRRAAALSPEPHTQAARLVRSADHARQVGLVTEADEALIAAGELPLTPAARVPGLAAAALVEMSARQPRLSLPAYLSLAADLAGPEGPASSAHLLERVTVLGSAAIRVINYPSTLQERRALDEALEAIAVQVPMGYLHLGRVFIDPLARAATRADLPGLLEQYADQPHLLSALGLSAEHLQDLATARSAWTRAAELFHRAGLTGDEAVALNGGLGQRLLSGRLSEGLAEAQTAYRMSTDLRMPMIAAAASAAESRFLTWLGRPAEASAALQRSRAEEVSDEVFQAAANTSWASGVLALAQRRWADAVADFTLVRRYGVFAQWSVADLAEAAAASGQSEQVREFVAGVTHTAEVFGAPHLQMLALRARALLADDDLAEELFTAAVAAGQEAGTPLELARTRLLLGEWLRRNRRLVDSRPHLTAALHAFDGAGARDFAERAATELRAAGSAPQRTSAASTPAATLTVQELQISRLAAAGMSNKEIADQLYLSHRTVGAHLYKAFPKLGITSRAQLRAALQAAGL